jgi:hypothetical protein
MCCEPRGPNFYFNTVYAVGAGAWVDTGARSGGWSVSGLARFALTWSLHVCVRLCSSLSVRRAAGSNEFSGALSRV